MDRFFTLSGVDLAEARQRRGEGNRLGWSLQLCGLRMLGFCPDEGTMAPDCRPDALVFSPAHASAVFMLVAMAAETERDLTKECTLDGLAAAAARGRKGRRPAVLDPDTLAVVLARCSRGESR